MRRLYQVQRIAAIALLALLLIHTHFVRHIPLDNPLWRIVDIAFLFTIVLHGLIGAYSVLAGGARVSRYRRALAAAVIVIGIVVFFYGARAILAFQAPGAALAAPP
ncbi:MAG: hypothetical protein Kow00120_09270 [Anaerolineae bacterium]